MQQIGQRLEMTLDPPATAAQQSMSDLLGRFVWDDLRLTVAGRLI
jgi:hypothetical protein